MKNFIFSLLLVTSIAGFSQKIERQLVGSGGDSFENTTIKYSHSVGDLTVSSYAGSLIVSSGFQQNIAFPTSIEEVQLNLQVKAYPNPTMNRLEIEMQSDKALFLEVEIRDIQGKKMNAKAQELQVDGLTTTSVDMSSYPKGTYIITLLDNNQVYGSLRVVKN